jgi:hypothetical protein
MTRVASPYRRALIVTALALSTIGIGATGVAQGQTDGSKPAKASVQEQLKGTWYSIAWGYKNQTAVDEYDYRVVFFDDTMEINEERFAYTLDSKKSPREIDLYFIGRSGEKRAESRPGLFALKRGTLLLQLAEKIGDERPYKVGLAAEQPGILYILVRGYRVPDNAPDVALPPGLRKLIADATEQLEKGNIENFVDLVSPAEVKERIAAAKDVALKEFEKEEARILNTFRVLPKLKPQRDEPKLIRFDLTKIDVPAGPTMTYVMFEEIDGAWVITNASHPK